MKITVGVSNRHVHMTEEDFKLIFGEDAVLEKERDINQPGQFAAKNKVDIVGPKSTLKGLRILGPFRSYTQVELSQTDCRTLGIVAPIRWSGDVEGSAEVEIVGPKASIKRNAGIIANRHIHIDKETRENLGLALFEKVALEIEGEKPSFLYDVFLKEDSKSYFEVHLDTDDANACQIKNGDEVRIIF